MRSHPERNLTAWVREQQLSIHEVRPCPGSYPVLMQVQNTCEVKSTVLVPDSDLQNIVGAPRLQFWLRDGGLRRSSNHRIVVPMYRCRRNVHEHWLDVVSHSSLAQPSRPPQRASAQLHKLPSAVNLMFIGLQAGHVYDSLMFSMRVTPLLSNPR
jgi:hypothetical protein